MVFLIEGFDKAGKSTLISLLKEQHNFQVFRSSNQIDSNVNLEKAIAFDWKFMLDFLSQVKVDVCFDRTFISQYVYSFLLREQKIKELYSIEEYLHIFNEYCVMLSTIDYKIIYCTRDDYKDEYDKDVDLSLSNKANGLFLEFFNRFDLNDNLIVCNFKDGIQTNLQRITGALR